MDLDDKVCLCFRISKRKLVNYLRRELPRVPSQLSECGGAGTGCGWCIPFLKQLFRQEMLTAVDGSVSELTATEYAEFKAGRMQWLSRWVEQYADQQLVVQEIHELGGRVEIESVNWLAQSIGPDFATVLDRIVLLHLAGPKVDDRVLHEVATQRRALSGVRRLELINTTITSAGLSALNDCQSLRYLDLTGTRVNSQAVRVLLHKLPSLETIVLDGTGVGWWSKIRYRWSRPGLSFSVSKDAGAPEGLV